MIDFLTKTDGAGHLDHILATSEIGMWELDAASGNAIRNLQHDRIFGHDTPLEEWSDDIFLTYVVEDDRTRVRELLEDALRDGTPWSIETQIRRADGAIRWISAKGMPTFSEDGDVAKLIGHVIDITDTKQNEDRLKLLSRELNHRVANTFAILNSMIRHTAKKSTTVDEFAESLMERLGALSRANRILIADESERSSLHSILDMELAAFSGWRSRVEMTGDANIWFSGEASEALALIFHELLTNAVKHGALSVPNGQVLLSISREEHRVHMKWRETGGPPIVTERRNGIGSSILRNAMRDEGTVELDYARDGLICDITVFNSYTRDLPTAPAMSEDAMPARHPGAADSVFKGRRITVVEDDPIIGMDLSEIFKSHGATVLGPYTTVATALKSLRDAPDAVLLDLNLGQETTEAVATQLHDLSVPFLILSGQIDKADLEDVFKSAPIVSKPFREQELVYRVSDLLK